MNNLRAFSAPSTLELVEISAMLAKKALTGSESKENGVIKKSNVLSLIIVLIEIMFLLFVCFVK
jgi:hypothetical protein